MNNSMVESKFSYLTPPRWYQCYVGILSIKDLKHSSYVQKVAFIYALERSDMFFWKDRALDSVSSECEVVGLIDYWEDCKNIRRSMFGL